MACGMKQRQLGTIDEALGSLSGLGVSSMVPGIRTLTSFRGKLMTQVGIKFPRTILQLLRLVGLSPGTIALWFDIEAGFMTEARADDRSMPVYRRASAETAAILLKGELTKALELELMAPDDYIGE